jgi:hypothetical protein
VFALTAANWMPLASTTTDMAYEQGKEINPEVLPYLDSFSNTAQAGYADDMAMLKRDALRELDAEIAGGDQQGRFAGYQRRATGQQFSDEADRFTTGLGLERAQLGEQLRVRGQGRTWDVADRDTRLSRLRSQALAKRERAQDEARGGLMGEIGGGVGSIIGGVVGAYYGGPTGAMLGAGAGGAVGGAVGSAF